MTPKEKAKELYFKMHSQEHIISKEAKQCALIAVEEIIEAIDWHAYEAPNKEIFFWEQVKTEIKKL
jgi:hypothetical protein